MTDDADGMFGVGPALQEATHVDIPDLPDEEGACSPIQVCVLDSPSVMKQCMDKACRAEQTAEACRHFGSLWWRSAICVHVPAMIR